MAIGIIKSGVDGGGEGTYSNIWGQICFGILN